MVASWRRRAQTTEAAEQFRIVNDAAAAQIIRDMGFDPARIKTWVEAHPRQIDITFARFGGVERLLEAARLLQMDDPQDLSWANDFHLGPESARKRHAWRLLAMAAGIIDLSHYSPLMRGVVQSYDGYAIIPFPSGRCVEATGIPEAWNDPTLVREGSITYAEV